MTTAADTLKSIKRYIVLLPVLLALLWVYYPTFVWMVERWNAPDSYFAHGFLIPVVTLFWIWKDRKSIAEAAHESWWPGYIITILGCAIQIFASFFRVYFISAFSFVLVLLGVVMLLFGREVTRRTAYPILFLLLMIPLPLLVISQLTLKMKFFVSEMAVHWLNASGIESVRNGSYIVMPNSFLLVGDPCSGLRSFLAFLCLGFVFAYGGGLPLWGKMFLVAVGLPLAILSNLLRVYGLSLIAEIYGQEAASGKVHDASGIIVFALAFLAFMAIRHWMELNHGQKP